MKKLFTTSIALLFAIGSFAQILGDFENVPLLSPDTVWNGPSTFTGLTGFTTGGAQFINFHDSTSGGFWSGWGYSSSRDSITAGYGNQMSAMPAKGQNNSTIYGVAYASPYSPEYNNFMFYQPRTASGFYITNSTYAYRSMLTGDAFSKKFGGSTGNDSDYFRLDLKGWLHGVQKPDSVSFYLADFRDANNANDYIVRDWRWVNLLPLGEIDSITYSLASTDTSFGSINTPAYFCMDNISSVPTSVNEVKSFSSIIISPNPFQDFLSLENKNSLTIQVELLSSNGQTLKSNTLSSFEKIKWSTKELSAGVYFLKIQQGQTSRIEKLIK